MKLRIEQCGLHYFDRTTGIHLLIDEIITEEIDYSIAPRTLSIAITNDCNANCPFCHVTKGQDYLPKEFIINTSKSVDDFGCFDIAIGGGEPLLHPDLAEICQTIWKETELGISLTTNGKLLNNSIIDSLTGSVSFIRISIDSANEEKYHELRGFPLSTIKENILKLNNRIQYGINMVITEDTINELDEMLDFAKSIGADELLLLPLTDKGKIALGKNNMKKLEEWITINYTKFPIKILEQAREFIDIPILFEDDGYYSDYLYLSAKKKLQRSSYTNEGLNVEIDNIENLLKDWRKGIVFKN